jgi:hypothetical protein
MSRNELSDRWTLWIRYVMRFRCCNMITSVFFILFPLRFSLQEFSPVELGKCTLATSLPLLDFLRTTAEYMY